MEQTSTRAWVEIYLDVLEDNTRKLRRELADGVLIMAVIKSDAYGHGARVVAQELERVGVDCFGLATLNECLELRTAGVTKPIVLLGYLHPAEYAKAITNDITLTVYSLDQAKNISKAAESLSKSVDIHIKIDTGMMRLGFLAGEEDIAAQACSLPYINAVGAFSHFSEANSHDKSFTNEQLHRFEKFITALQEMGISIPLKHIANSPGVMHGGFEQDLVRVAVLLFGVSSFPGETMEEYGYSMTIAVKSRVSMVKTVPSGTPVGYGRTYHTTKQTKIATIAFGYADGYTLANSNRGEVLIRGKRAQVIGKVCMDQFMVDVTHIDGVAEHDEVVILGKQGKDEITLPELAKNQGTIVHESLSVIGRRVPRVYIRNGKCVGIINYTQLT